MFVLRWPELSVTLVVIPLRLDLSIRIVNNLVLLPIVAITLCINAITYLRKLRYNNIYCNSFSMVIYLV